MAQSNAANEAGSILWVTTKGLVPETKARATVLAMNALDLMTSNTRWGDRVGQASALSCAYQSSLRGNASSGVMEARWREANVVSKRRQ
ncbi:hypothetical protein CH63R_02562 [Colletotrichum higginsianum IMI 349063]|uniref:Uncharacterized protein n=1 Tax=Colletotrichum higginsianum (strain IMI 349063) TaxID=759273 RepID=A0A1B7YP54_COLHI|nr:hypothetical protein CH63R_02562 [Colletotrichum higginsianum IMI 349063]OBR13836.1 hypothetical protein CH63R_02562 [Colletotrichum higginsianum IMI 349063]